MIAMSVTKDKILVIGASGQIGVELTMALRKQYGNANVIASDLREQNPLLEGTGPYVSLDVMNKEMLHVQVIRQNITQIYLLAAILSATGEKNPNLAWHLNMQGLLNVLDIAREEKCTKYIGQAVSRFSVLPPLNKIVRNKRSLNLLPYMASVNMQGSSGAIIIITGMGLMYAASVIPDLISYKSEPGGGTTDYAVEIYHEALENKKYKCFLSEDTYLPMMYMPDAIRATMELMEAPSEKIGIRTSYNISGMSFSPKEIAAEIAKHIP
jgi:nucleoside-diphosphate-sugar epimerase